MAKKKVKKRVDKEIKIDVKRDIKFNSGDWPYEDDSVSEVTCIGVFEFIPGSQRGEFMDEVYRVLKPGGKAIFRVPYWNTFNAVQDYATAWPPLCEASFCYFDKKQRESIGITGETRQIKCDFEVGFGYDVPADIAGKNEETRSFQIKHYANVITSLNVVLTKRSE